MEIRIEIPKFKTHIRKSKNKYVKINGQSLFVGMDHHLRSLLVRKIHAYLKQFIPADLDLSGMMPLRIRLEFHAPINYERVRMMKDKNTGVVKLSWKKPSDTKIRKVEDAGMWDVDNQWIWGKCFNDTLTEMGLIPDDCVKFVRCSGQVEFKEVSHIDERKLVFIIEQYKDGNNDI